MKRLTLLVPILLSSTAARAQTFSVWLNPHPGGSVHQGGCSTLTDSSPVSLSGCEIYGGCTGYGLLGTGHASCAPSEIEYEVTETVRSWMNHCGSGFRTGGGGEWIVPVIFSGPTPTVNVQLQVNYEWSYTISHEGSGSPCCFGLSVNAGIGLVNYGGVGGALPIGQSTGDSGVLVSQIIAVPTGVEIGLRVFANAGTHSGGPGEGTDIRVYRGSASLPQVGPIFILPDGYTANSIVLGIVNNQFPPPPCEGDADGDFMVTFADITSVLTNWGANYAPSSGPGDSNHDSTVDFADITSTLSNWGSTCP